MGCIGWNHKYLTWNQPMGHSIYRKLKLPFQHIGNLLMRMLVHGQCCARHNPYMGIGSAGSMNKLGSIALNKRFGLDVADLV